MGKMKKNPSSRGVSAASVQGNAGPGAENTTGPDKKTVRTTNTRSKLQHPYSYMRGTPALPYIYQEDEGHLAWFSPVSWPSSSG
ncbi:YuzL family protein [Neobacillus sp. FSL H8-0543]|uniref:YuzL family protein n=1 Tax=Neobacillus sp. FSL H8-0543 TaxID=2954672 RepID=UPI003159068A